MASQLYPEIAQFDNNLLELIPMRGSKLLDRSLVAILLNELHVQHAGLIRFQSALSSYREPLCYVGINLILELYMNKN